MSRLSLLLAALPVGTSGAAAPSSSCGSLDLRGLGAVAREAFAGVHSVDGFESAMLGLYDRRQSGTVVLPTLRKFFTDDLQPDAAGRFWSHTLPTVVDWAARVEELFAPAAEVPFLCNSSWSMEWPQRPANASADAPSVEVQRLEDGLIRHVSFSRAQTASLLCHALLCTIPGRDSFDETTEGFAPFSLLPLFAGDYEGYRGAKLLMLWQYFSELPPPAPQQATRMRQQSIHIWRRVVSVAPDWGRSAAPLPRFVVDWKEDGLEAYPGSVQVGMSNRYPGGAPGGVLNTGKFQEPIFFAERPELLLLLLVSQALDPSEALVISGARQFGASVGIGPTVTAKDGGADARQRRVASTQDLLQLDAIDFRPADAPPEFGRWAVERELLKLYAGHSAATQREPARLRKRVDATGNWCCDAFLGDKQLKAVLQLIAGGAASLRELRLFPDAYSSMPTNASDFPPLALRGELATTQGLYKALLAFLDLPGDQKSKEGRLFEYLAQRSAAPGALFVL